MSTTHSHQSSKKQKHWTTSYVWCTVRVGVVDYVRKGVEKVTILMASLQCNWFYTFSFRSLKPKTKTTTPPPLYLNYTIKLNGYVITNKLNGIL